MSLKDRWTHSSFATQLLCVELMLMLVSGGLVILLGSTITNLEMRKLSPDMTLQFPEEKKLSFGHLT